jgi:hypothetical protein
MSEVANIDLNTTPALQPPPGEVSNLQNPQSLQRFLVITATLGLSISALAVLLRVFTKAHVLKRIQPEEYVLILSELGFFAFTVVMIAAGHSGQGRHQWDVSIAQLQRVIHVCPNLPIFLDHDVVAQ